MLVAFLRANLLYVIIAAILAGGLYTWRDKIIQAVQTKEVIAQVKHQKKVEKFFDEVDKEAPSRDNPHAVAKFLFQRTVDSQ